MLGSQYEGIFIDCACLPQRDADGYRSAEDEAIFQRGLVAMGAFYSSAKGSTVMQIKTIPTPPEDYTGTYDSSRPYDASGWCIFEECTAQLVTGTEALNAHRLGLLREPLALFTAYCSCCSLRSAATRERAVARSVANLCASRRP